jgi:putative membrane protein
MFRATTAFAVIALAAATTLAADKSSASLDSKDAKFLKEAAIGAMAEVQMGEIAQNHATNADVKAFGARMATDHGKELDELKQLASSKGVELPTELDKKHKSMAEKMSKMQGADFDKSYSKDMLADHKKDLKDFKSQADSAKDADVKAFAAKYVPALEEHLSLAEKLPANAGSGSSSSASTDHHAADHAK